MIQTVRPSAPASFPRIILLLLLSLLFTALPAAAQENGDSESTTPAPSSETPPSETPQNKPSLPETDQPTESNEPAEEKEEPSEDGETATEPASAPLILHQQGDTSFAINAGLVVPLFNLDMDANIQDPNISPGPYGSLQWAMYMNRSFKAGFEIGGFMGFSPNGNSMVMVPLTAMATYEWNFYPFTIPVHLGIGANIVRYKEFFNLDFLVKPGTGVYWNMENQWAFGLNLFYLWDIQRAEFEESSSQPDPSRFGNFMEISLSALYHF